MCFHSFSFNQNEEPTDQSTQSINERENIRKSTNANDTEMDKDERELNVEKLKNEDLSEVDGNLEDNQNKHENFNTADERLVKTIRQKKMTCDFD